MRVLAVSVFFAALILLAGCGFDETYTRTSSPPSTSPYPPPTKLITIGNSITLHIPDASIGWSGNWGMAASAQNKDYSHLTADAMHLPVTPINIPGFETNAITRSTFLQALATAGIDSTTIVVVEFGDNVPDSWVSYWNVVYEDFLGAIPPHLKLVCLSTFWERPSVDFVIKYECEAHGGLYTYIGNIYTDPNNPDRADHTYSDPYVNMHPHDWGMAQISGRILTEVNPGTRTATGGPTLDTWNDRGRRNLKERKIFCAGNLQIEEMPPNGLVTLLEGPDIDRARSDVVGYGKCFGVLCHVDRFQIAAA